MPKLQTKASTIASFWFSFFHLPLGFTYGAWTALNIVLMCFSGVIIWKEKFTKAKIVGVVLVIFGVVLMRIG